jgi:hypothetical protein
MISQKTIEHLESDPRQCDYILGTRLRLVKEISEEEHRVLLSSRT